MGSKDRLKKLERYLKLYNRLTDRVLKKDALKNTKSILNKPWIGELMELQNEILKPSFEKYNIDPTLLYSDKAGLYALSVEKQKEFKETFKQFLSTLNLNSQEEQETTGSILYDKICVFRNEMRELIGEEKLNSLIEEEKKKYDLFDETIKKELIIERLQAEVKRLKKENKEQSKVFKYTSSLAKITGKISRNKGLSDKDWKGYANDKAIWKTKDLIASILIKDLSSLDLSKRKNPSQKYLIPTAPKIAVSQSKNICTLVVLLEIENRKRVERKQEKTGEFEFSLKEYAAIRGKDSEQLSRGGKFVNDLKMDLISGSITSYILDVATEKATYYGTFYTLKESWKRKGKWKIFFNEPYRTMLLTHKQYYPLLLQAIQDKGTDNQKGYLFFFTNLIMQWANTGNNFKTQLKVNTILDKIDSSDKVKNRPLESFKKLCECIYYSYSNYKINGCGMIKEVTFFDNNKCEKSQTISNLERFNTWDYDSFKNEILKPLGLTDIRNAFISFSIPQQQLRQVERIEQAEIPEPEHATKEGAEIPDL